VAEWILAIAQTMVEIRVHDMEIVANADNPQGIMVMIAEAIGEAEVMKAGVAEEWAQVIRDMEMDAVNQDTETVQEVIGEVEVAKAVPAVAAVILMINIWEEDNQDDMRMTMIVRKEVAEVVRAWDEAVHGPQAGVVDAAAIGNLFRKTTIKR